MEEDKRRNEGEIREKIKEKKIVKLRNVEEEEEKQMNKECERRCKKKR